MVQTCNSSCYGSLIQLFICLCFLWSSECHGNLRCVLIKLPYWICVFRASVISLLVWMLFDQDERHRNIECLKSFPLSILILFSTLNWSETSCWIIDTGGDTTEEHVSFQLMLGLNIQGNVCRSSEIAFFFLFFFYSFSTHIMYYWNERVCTLEFAFDEELCMLFQSVFLRNITSKAASKHELSNWMTLFFL